MNEKNVIKNDLLYTNLPIISEEKNEIVNKYFWKDGSTRPTVARIQDYQDFEEIITAQLKTSIITASGSQFKLMNNFLISTDSSIYINNLNQLWKNDLCKYLICFKNLPSNFNNESWIGRVYNQGLTGDCYANSAAFVINASYGRKLLNQYTHKEISLFLDTIFPSRSLLIYIFNTIQRGYLPNTDLLSQGGVSSILYKYVQINNGIVTEYQYNYPDILNILEDLKTKYPNNYYQVFLETFDCNSQLYLISDYFSKFVESPSPILTQSSTFSTNYYAKGQTYILIAENDDFWFPLLDSENHLYGLAQKKNSNGQFLYFDKNGLETTEKTQYGVPQNSYLVYLNIYKNCICNHLLFSFDCPLYSNFPFDKNSSFIYDTPNANDTLIAIHTVTCIGYDNKTQLLFMRNSWGIEWGLKGNFYITYNFIKFMLSYQGMKTGNTILHLITNSTIIF
jgi:hypothetical protein